MPVPPRYDDQDGVLRAIGAMPILAREAVDHGFFNYCQSRRLDPGGYAEFSDCTRANVLYCRIAAVGRELVDLVGDPLRWQISRNKRATEILLDPFYAFRIKRVKQNRAGLSTSVATARQAAIKSMPPVIRGQMVFPFPGMAGVPERDEDRLWLTVAFDLDEIEESVRRVSIGVELSRRFLWKVPLPEPELDVIASLPAPLADRVVELRQQRSA